MTTAVTDSATSGRTDSRGWPLERVLFAKPLRRVLPDVRFGHA